MHPYGRHASDPGRTATPTRAPAGDCSNPLTAETHGTRSRRDCRTIWSKCTSLLPRANPADYLLCFLRLTKVLTVRAKDWASIAPMTAVKAGARSQTTAALR